MNYKNFLEPNYSVDTNSFELYKEPLDGKADYQVEEIFLFPDLMDSINKISNSIDIKDSLYILDSLFYSDDGPRPNPNRLLHQTDLLNSILEITFSTNDEYILFLCLRILVHISLADSLLDSQLLNPDLASRFVDLMNLDYSEDYNNQIHQAIMHILLNISLDSDFSLDIANAIIINNNLINTLSVICMSDFSPKDLILSYRISINIAQLLYENELIEYLNTFNCIIQSAISSLKLCLPQKFAIELLSYLFYNKECCDFALQFNIIEMIKQSLETLPNDSIPNAFTAINSLISNCNLIDEFIDDSVIKKVINTFKKVDSEKTHPFFTFIDSLSDNRINCLENYHIIQFLFDLVDDSLINKRNSICILVNIIDQNWKIYPKSKPKPVWITQALKIIIENINCLTSENAEIALNLLINIFYQDKSDFINTIQQTDLEECLESILDIEDCSEKVKEYVQVLYDLINGQEN